MVCQACHRWGPSLCRECRSDLRPAQRRLIDSKLAVRAAFEHSGPAVPLVHDLKYRGIVGFADVVADVLASACEPRPLVPIPRVWTRRLGFGVDASLEIARRLSDRWDMPVVHAMRRPLHARRRAGNDHSVAVPDFMGRDFLFASVYIVDDVVTTGATVMAAARAVGLHRVESALAANLVSGVSRLSRP